MTHPLQRPSTKEDRERAEATFKQASAEQWKIKTLRSAQEAEAMAREENTAGEGCCATGRR